MILLAQWRVVPHDVHDRRIGRSDDESSFIQVIDSMEDEADTLRVVGEVIEAEPTVVGEGQFDGIDVMCRIRRVDEDRDRLDIRV